MSNPWINNQITQTSYLLSSTKKDLSYIVSYLLSCPEGVEAGVDGVVVLDGLVGDWLILLLYRKQEEYKKMENFVIMKITLFSLSCFRMIFLKLKFDFS